MIPLWPSPGCKTSLLSFTNSINHYGRYRKYSAHLIFNCLPNICPRSLALCMSLFPSLSLSLSLSLYFLISLLSLSLSLSLSPLSFLPYCIFLIKFKSIPRSTVPVMAAPPATASSTSLTTTATTTTQSGG